MGRNRRRKGRDIHGVLLLDKPKGISTNQALQRAKRLFGAAKAGHTGNLDPMATGMLPLCFGHATRVSAFLLDADKVYRAAVKLGELTDSGDADGVVIETAVVPELSEDDLHAVAEQFLGAQQQIPPMYSALKHDGQRLYKLARQGIEVERAPRDITIYSITELALTADGFEFTVHCSKGTYVRVLAEDISKALGTIGHLVALRRTAVGSFDADLPMVTIDQLTELNEEQGSDAVDALLMPADRPIIDWPEAELGVDAASSLCHGQPVFTEASRKSDVGTLLRVYDKNRKFLGIGKVDPDGRLAPHRVFAPGEQAVEASGDAA